MNLSASLVWGASDSTRVQAILRGIVQQLYMDEVSGVCISFAQISHPESLDLPP